MLFQHGDIGNPIILGKRKRENLFSPFFLVGQPTIRPIIMRHWVEIFFAINIVFKFHFESSLSKFTNTLNLIIVIILGFSVISILI